MSLVTPVFYALHIGGGTVGLFSGVAAVSVEKGGRVHRIASVFMPSKPEPDYWSMCQVMSNETLRFCSTLPARPVFGVIVIL